MKAFAKAAGFEVIAEFCVQAVSGADPIEDGRALATMLEHIAGNGARTNIVETANRFARDLVVQENGMRRWSRCTSATPRQCTWQNASTAPTQ